MYNESLLEYILLYTLHNIAYSRTARSISVHYCRNVETFLLQPENVQFRVDTPFTEIT